MNDKHLPPTPLHLDTAFSDIAASAGAAATDGTTGTLEVRRLVKRSRRQRATALGASGFVVLGLAGIGLSGLLTPAPIEILPAPPITPSPTTSVEPLSGTFAPVCGDDLSEVLATTTPLTLAPNGATSRPFDLASTSDSALTIGSPGRVAVHLIDAEGDVVAIPTTDEAPAEESPARLDLDPGETADLWPSDVAACDTAPLAAGTYSAIGTVTAEITPAHGTPAAATVVGGPWTVTIDDTGRLTSIAGVAIDDEPTTSPPPTATDAEPPAGPVNPGGFASPTFTFPGLLGAPEDEYQDVGMCLAPALTPTKGEALGQLKFGQPDVTVVSGSTVTVELTQSAVPNARVDDAEFGGLVFWSLTKDGLIVANGMRIDDQRRNTHLDEQTPVREQFEVVPRSCATPDSPNLPPGDYLLSAYKPYRVSAYSLRLQDGTWGPVNSAMQSSPPFFFDGALVAEPIPFTIR
ncbi:hypothetical protein ACFP63_16250 [Oerskovia jenensis]|uniref:Uncharacterized protein n=1 Tax=Oerskovia jenensis TaxID=162169 RepID=A0ABS2LE34_9CELL|nr:hypothetical protein [Oerskovia jenensis]MBM7478680.1 hypothetical protein [Oerskovia jenensis]